MKEVISKFWKEKSILSIEKLVDWKKKMKPYNFTSLPETVIIDGSGNKESYWARINSKKLKGIKGNHIVSKNGKYLMSSNIGNGAPELILVCEELRCLGVKNFIFIGLGGIIAPKIKEGSYHLISKAYSGTGTAQYYSENEVFHQQSSAWSQNILKEISCNESTCFSTDAPFRETKSLIQELKKNEVQLIEMECAALYAFAEYYSLNSICFLIGADKISDNWTPPNDFTNIIKKKTELIKKLISL